jgi:hypothetical protein
LIKGNKYERCSVTTKKVNKINISKRRILEWSVALFLPAPPQLKGGPASLFPPRFAAQHVGGGIAT